MKYNKENPIPPRSVIKLVMLWPWAVKNGYSVGQEWRIGYYSEKDGYDYIWMVDDEGVYEQAGNHDWISKYFEIIEVSDESDLLGVERDPIGKRV